MEKLQKVQSFKNLRSIQGENGKNEYNVNERERQVGNFYKIIGGKVHSKNITQKNQEIIYKTYYIPN